MRIFAALFSCFLISAATLAQESADLVARAKEDAIRRSNVEKNWGPKMNSPGVVASLKEIARHDTGGHTAVIYRILTTGLPDDGIYSLTSVDLNLNVSTVLDGITLDKSGQAICAGTSGTCSGDAPNDPVSLTIFAARGEPKRFALVSKDEKTKAFVSVTPFPITGTDQGCSIEAILLTPNAEVMLIHGSGFDRNSVIHSVATSEKEKQEGDVKSDATGDVYETQLPYVKGHVMGSSKVTLISKTCSPSISYQWGRDVYRMQ